MFSSSYHHNRALEAQSHLEHLARSGDFNALLHHNLAEAHVLQFETSPERTLRGNAFRNAKLSSRSMISTLPSLRASAQSEAQNRQLDELQQKLEVVHKQVSDYMGVHQSKAAIAVFESVSSFLGVEAVLPERAGQVRTLFGGGRVALGWKENAKKGSDITNQQVTVPSTNGSLTVSTGEPVEAAHGSPVATTVATSVEGSASPPMSQARPVDQEASPTTTASIKDQLGSAPEPTILVKATQNKTEVSAITSTTTLAETSGTGTTDQIGPDVPTIMPLPPEDNVAKEKQQEKPASSM